MKKHQPLLKHATHSVEIREQKDSKHYGKYWCLECDMWVSWISKDEWTKAKELGLVVADPIKNKNAKDLLL